MRESWESECDSIAKLCDQGGVECQSAKGGTTAREWRVGRIINGDGVVWRRVSGVKDCVKVRSSGCRCP